MLTLDAEKRCRRWFWILLTAVTLLRLALAGRVGLGVDESHYVMFSRRLAWGYFDHPPMVAWLGAATMHLGGGPFWVRLGPILCAAASLGLIRRLALRLYGSEQVALWALLLMLAMPTGHLLASGLLPDATLGLFWCGALLALWRGLATERWRDWVLAGVMFGGALLSKYHGVLLPLCLFVYLAVSPARRRWLRKPQPYAAVGLGLLIFLPNILWNAGHGWISYAFQLAHGRGSGTFTWSKVAETLGGQAAAASPVLFGMLLVAFLYSLWPRRLRDEGRFLVWMSLPVFALFGLAGMTGKILPHWPFVGWWSGVLLLAALVTGAEGTAPGRWRSWARGGLAIGAVLVAFVYFALFTPLVEPTYNVIRMALAGLPGRTVALPAFQPDFDLTHDLYGWEEIARQVEACRAERPRPERTFIFCRRFYHLSQVGVYLPPGTVLATLSDAPDQYRLWFDPAAHLGWDAIFLDDGEPGQGLGRLEPRFETWDPAPRTVCILRHGRVAHRLTLRPCSGFKGWVPEAQNEMILPKESSHRASPASRIRGTPRVK